MENLLSIRKQLNLGQETFAQMLGISRSTISMFENGNRPLPVAVLIKLGQMQIQAQKSAEGIAEADFSGELEAIQTKNKEILTNFMRKKEEALMELQKKMNEKKNNHELAKKALKLIESERNLFLDIPGLEDKMEAQYDQAKKNYVRTYPSRFLELEMQIAELETMIDFAKEKLKPLS